MGEFHLHWGFNGEHVLVPFIIMKSFPSFLLACLFVVALCVTERIITHYHEGTQALNTSSSRWRTALRRCLLFWIAMILRLFYMLATMTFHIPLILVIATSLAVTQLFLDLRVHSRPSHSHFTQLGSETPGFDTRGYANQPIPTSPASTFVALESVTPKHPRPNTVSSTSDPLPTMATRPRSKSKPDLDIFIHPAESNIARADALAMQMGLAADTERVHIAVPGSATWETGKGPDVAKKLLVSKSKASAATSTSGRRPNGHLHQRSGSISFQIGNTSSGEEESDDESDRDAAETRNLVR